MTYNIINIDLSHSRIDEVYNLTGDSIKVLNATSDCFIQFDDTTQEPINLLLVGEIKIKFTKFYISNVGVENQYIKIIVSENFNLCDRISIPDYIPETIPEPTINFITPQIINITNSEPNVQVELNLSNLNFDAFNNTGSNIRITDENYIPLNFYLDSFNKIAKSGKLFFKTPNKIINKAFIFNINLEAKTVSDGDATFEFFDGFTGTAIDSTKWNVIDSTGWSVINGELRGSNTTGRLLSHKLFSDGIIQEVKARTVAPAPNGHTIGSFWLNTSDGLSLTQVINVDMSRNDATTLNIGNAIPDGNIDFLIQFIVSPTIVNIKITRLDTNVITYDVVYTNSVINESIMLGLRPDNILPNQSYETYWDWIRIRKVTAATAMIV